jgi:hypothetical protein
MRACEPSAKGDRVYMSVVRRCGDCARNRMTDCYAKRLIDFEIQSLDLSQIRDDKAQLREASMGGLTSGISRLSMVNCQ